MTTNITKKVSGYDFIQTIKHFISSLFTNGDYFPLDSEKVFTSVNYNVIFKMSRSKMLDKCIIFETIVNDEEPILYVMYIDNSNYKFINLN